MLFILDVMVVLIYGTVCFFALVASLRSRMLRSVDLITGMVFVFYVLPLAYNVVIGASRAWDTSYTPGGLHAQYDLIVLATLALIRLAAWHRFRFRASQAEVARQWNHPLLPGQREQILRRIGWFLLFLPPIAVILISPNPAAYLRYGTIELRNIRPGSAGEGAYVLINFFVTLAVFGFFLVFLVNVRQHRRFWTLSTSLALILALVAAYICGKRSIPFLLLLIIIGLSWFEARLRLTWAAVLATVFVMFSFVYLSFAKDRLVRSAQEYVRGDLARDYTLIGVLRATNFASNDMLPYPGAGYFFQVVFLVPRSGWDDKPYPTSVYVTSAILHTPELVLGWGFGIGFQEESLANFGYVGFVCVCLLVGRLCRKIDRLIYEKNSIFAFCWLPLVFGTVFAIYVIFIITVAAAGLALVIAIIIKLAGLPQQPESLYYPETDVGMQIGNDNEAHPR